MRHPNAPEAVLILDDLPELKVVLAGLEDPNLPKPPLGEPEQYSDYVGYRFHQEAMHEPRPPAADAYVEDVFNLYPEFTIRPEDAFFILKCAERILAQNKDGGPTFRFYNRVAGRTRAAKKIIDALEAKLY